MIARLYVHQRRGDSRYNVCSEKGNNREERIVALKRHNNSKATNGR